MNILIVGGPKSGEWIETIAGAKVWLDIMHATTYLIRPIKWGLSDANGVPTEAFRLHIAVHPDISGHPQADRDRHPDDPTVRDGRVRPGARRADRGAQRAGCRPARERRCRARAEPPAAVTLPYLCTGSTVEA